MKKLFMAGVRGYQKFISPMFPPSCRYHPTCSQYTLEAIDRHGAFKGSLMGAARILRCNPFAEGGFDPVPDHFSLKRQHVELTACPELSPEEERAHYLTRLLDRYQDSLIIQEDIQDGQAFLKEIFALKTHSVVNLPDAYLADVLAYVGELGLEEPQLKVFEVTDFSDDLDLTTAQPPFDSGLNQALEDNQSPYILVEPDLGVIDTSHPDLTLDLVASFGVRDKDIEDLTPRLYHYLLTLDRA